MSLDASADAVRYRTEISRVEDQTLQQALEASSNLQALQDQKDAPGAAGLVRRAMRDRERMWSALRSFGFYAGDVRVTIAGLPLESKDLIPRLQEMAGGEPVVVAIAVETGPLFTIGRFELLDTATGEADLRVEIDRSVLGISRGDPARAESVIRAESALVEQMRGQGHPFASVPERQVIVDHATLEMEVTLAVEPGPRAVFGTVTIEGLEEMDEGFVQSRLDPGRDIAYSPEEIRGMRDRLADLEVFSRIGVETADTLDTDGRLPVFVEVTERPRRVVGFSADFNTSEGFGARAYWGHRNLFGGAESLRLQVEVGRIGRNAPGDIDYGLGARYRAPDFLARDQVFFAELSAGRETPEAYRREAIEALVGIDRRLSERLEVSAGVKAEFSEVDDITSSGRLFFLSVPLGLRLDTTDDPLDPTRGARLALETTPFFGDRGFVRTSLAGATYYDLFGDQGLVLAGRARLGGILGAEPHDVPGDKRFYAGGGGSVRGYAFQAIGPRTPAGDPVGGLSLLELGLEARIRFTDELGLVTFFEGGQVFEDELPSFDEKLQLGAGLGLRYFTGIGPLRLDVAFPLDKRRDDDDFQIYVSIGQAF